MTREEAIEILLTADFPEYYTIREVKQALNMAIQSLTAISELSQSLKAVNRYEMDEKVLIGFNMAVAIFNKCFGEESCALKNEPSEQNVGMCQQNVGEMSEQQTDGDLISRQKAIDTIEALYLDGDSVVSYLANADGDTLIGKYQAITVLDDLPSVTPQLKMRWIPVSKELPNFNDIVLASVYYDDKSTRPVIIKYGGEKFWLDGTIKAWMPLPEPYKAE